MPDEWVDCVYFPQLLHGSRIASVWTNKGDDLWVFYQDCHLNINMAHKKRKAPLAPESWKVTTVVSSKSIDGGVMKNTPLISDHYVRNGNEWVDVYYFDKNQNCQYFGWEWGKAISLDTSPGHQLMINNHGFHCDSDIAVVTAGDGTHLFFQLESGKIQEFHQPELQGPFIPFSPTEKIKAEIMPGSRFSFVDTNTT